jgi:hypothetical protein
VTQDGRITATDADLTGIVTAIGGQIGNLAIEDGIKGYNDKELSFSLTNTGLSLYNKQATLNVGDITFYCDTDQSPQENYLYSYGKFIIGGMSGKEVATAIILNSEGGATDSDVTITLWRRDLSSGTRLKLISSSPMIHRFSCVLYYQLYQGIMNDGDYGENDSGDTSAEYPVWSFSFVIDVDETESNVQYCYRPYDYSNDAPFTIRFGLTPEACTHGTSFEIGSTNDYVETLSLTTVPQVSYTNNIVIKGNLIPENASYAIGSSETYWKGAYLGSSTIVTSDRNKKNTIQNLPDSYGYVFDSLVPVAYKYNDGESDRFHTGFIAQDVKAAIEKAGLTTQDMAAYCEWKNDDGSTGCALRYEEFIALCVDQIQKLKARVAELEDKLTTTQND